MIIATAAPPTRAAVERGKDPAKLKAFFRAVAAAYTPAGEAAVSA